MNKSLCILILLVICFLFLVSTTGQGFSPCPDVFQFATGSDGRVYGQIRAPRPQNDEKVVLRVDFEVPNLVQGGNGKIELLPEDYRSTFVNYNIFFPYWERYLPRIINILINDQQICTGPPYNRQIVPLYTKITLWNTRTRIITLSACESGICDQQNVVAFRPTMPKKPSKVYPNLETILNNIENIKEPGTIVEVLSDNITDIIDVRSNRPSNVAPQRPMFTPSPWDAPKNTKLNRHQNNFSNNQPTYPIVTPTSADVNDDSSTNNDILNSNNSSVNTVINFKPDSPRIGKPYSYSDVCGISSDVNHLIYNGKPLSSNLDFPWLAAIYKNNFGLNFICGGSLISNKHVVTAAHCMKVKDATMQASELTLTLGQKNLKEWGSKEILLREAEQTIVHPDYRKSTADADIAVIVLEEEVIFTPNIKPICLWMEDNALEKVVGKEGVIVGWGRNEKNELLSYDAKMINLPIVNQETCYRSNGAFLPITSNRSFCAGYKNDSGPCNGDSGGGFVMKVKDRWILRGIISLSLSKPDRICNLSEYVVFTDASKFIDWLLSFIT